MIAGIVGLPNVGKSTLFNAITRSMVEAANYPFATIEPNLGVVNVPDQRLDQLAALINPDKVTKAVFRFMDIAGLVKGASKGEGLGNKFLASIREVDLICHVVRCFADSNIVHVNTTVDAKRDIDTVMTELMLADLEVLQNRVAKITRKASAGDALSVAELEACRAMTDSLNNLQVPTIAHYSEAVRQAIGTYNLLCLKPVIYVANLAPEDLTNPDGNEQYRAVFAHAAQTGSGIVAISAQFDAELSVMSEQDRVEMMAGLNIPASGVDILTRAAFDRLNLKTFFTFGKQEVRAWVFTNGMTAPQCAGVIHSDFERGFIKCETVRWKDLLDCGSEQEVKNRGLLRIEGKDYVMQDGDVCHFRFNVSK